MKKYMIVALFVFCQSHAMEQVCHLSKMPVDVLDLIASFLMESEDEFVERTRIQKEITQECNNLFDERNLECIRWSFSPDEAKLAAVVCDNPARLPINAIGYAHYLTIINLHGIKPEIMLQKTLSWTNSLEYDCIALSHRGNLLATFYENKECFEGEDFSEYIFKIQRVHEKKERNIYFPYDFYPDIIAFNKQGTHLIAHGKDPITKEAIHKIFPLKRVDPDKPQVVVKTTNKLQEYFRDKFVCNQYIEGKK